MTEKSSGTKMEDPQVPSPERERRRVEVLKHLETVEQFISPQVVRLTELVADPDHDFQDVINTVKTDAGLTVSILRAINSAAYGLVNKITSIERAVTFLGERFVISAALEGCAGSHMGEDLPGYRRGESDFSLWDHNLRTAILARELASLHNKRDAEAQLPLDMVYTCGLLHDLGKVAISDYLQKCEPDLIESFEAGACSLTAEDNLVGVNHAIAGEMLARQWRLPAPLPTIVKYHHRPDYAIDERQPMAYCIWLANRFSPLQCCDEEEVETLRKSLGHGWTYALNLPGDAFDRSLWRMEQEYRRLKAVMA